MPPCNFFFSLTPAAVFTSSRGIFTATNLATETCGYLSLYRLQAERFFGHLENILNPGSDGHELLTQFQVLEQGSDLSIVDLLGSAVIVMGDDSE